MSFAAERLEARRALARLRKRGVRPADVARAVGHGEAWLARLARGDAAVPMTVVRAVKDWAAAVERPVWRVERERRRAQKALAPEREPELEEAPPAAPVLAPEPDPAPRPCSGAGCERKATVGGLCRRCNLREGRARRAQRIAMRCARAKLATSEAQLAR